MEFGLTENNITENTIKTVTKPFWFFVCFVGHMDMYGDLATVAEYLKDHQNWFCRCAKPMTTEPIGENGYVLNIGRFGALGYEVEPKIAVVLDPPQDDLYVMRTIPVPNYESLGYEVQYKSLMELTQISQEKFRELAPKSFLGKKIAIPANITKVTWQLDLAVTVEFPKFIEKLPSSLVQSTGDRLLGQIVRQISPRLTYKVQQDFHSSMGLATPGKYSRGLSKIEKECDFIVPVNDDCVVSSKSEDRQIPGTNNRVA